MYKIARGYKQGRAVMFYDITAIDGSCAKQLVPKDEIVKMCDNGEIGNAKIQWWEGKPIVRCSDKNLPLVKVDDSKNIIGEASHTVRNTANRQETNAVQVKSEVKGKLATKAHKRSISCNAYIVEKPVEKFSNIPGAYSEIKTLEDLFNKIAEDFRVRRAEEYKKEFSKKIDISKELSKLTPDYIKCVQHSIATYLMNMSYDETADVYLKY